MKRRLRQLLDRLRDWWDGPPGRHGYAWTYEGPPVAARLTFRDLGDAETELADALLRAKYPRLFWPPDRYWQDRYQDLFAWSARQTAARNSWRAAWGLEPETLLDPPLKLAAA